MNILKKYYAAIVLGLIFTFSGVFLLFYYIYEINSAKEFYELFETDLSCNVLENEEVYYSPTSSDDIGLDRLRSMTKIFPEMIGYLSVPGTNISYPVGQSLTDPDKFSNHLLDGSKNAAGTLFLDPACSLQSSKNFIIYGHNMKNGSMFHDLRYFKDSDFASKNNEIYFTRFLDDDVVIVKYRIVACAELSGKMLEKLRSTGDIFLYNENRISRFEDFIQSNSLWFSADFDFNKEFITLTTCDYVGNNDSRVLIIAEKE